MLKNICKSVPAEAAQALIDLRSGGVAWKVALATTGISYANGWLIVERAGLEAMGLTVDTTGMTEAEIKAEIKTLRDRDASWGTIMVTLDITEGKARKIWESASGVHSEGTRTGKGGRFLFGAPVLYQGELAKSGTLLDAEQPKAFEAYVGAAEATRIVHLPLEELRSLAEEYGVSAKGTKAAVTQRIRKAMAAQAK